MFWNYLKTSLRIFWRQRIISLINLVGLSAGLAGSFIILLFLLSEISFDRFHKNGNTVYRIFSHDTVHQTKIAAGPYLLGRYIREELPDVAEVVSIYFAEDLNISIEDGRADRKPEFMDAPLFLCVDSGFFDVFTFPVVRGNVSMLFRNPNALAISEKMAERFFPGKDPLGSTLQVNHKGDVFYLTIHAVFKDFPENSSIKAEYISGIDLAFDFMVKDIISTGEVAADGNYYRTDWMAPFFPTFILFGEKVDIQAKEKGIKSIAETHNPDDSRKFKLQRLRDIHLNSSDLFTIWIHVGDKKNLYLFSIIGLLLLLVATNNYILLATASSLKRVRETGIRKVTGAMKKDLWNQLIVESSLFALITFPFALILVEVSLPKVNQLFGTTLDLYSSNIHLVLLFLLITLVIGMVSGWYNAVFLSRSTPVEILKDKYTVGHKKNLMRRGLIMIQLITFTGLMVCAGFVERQIHYMMHKDLGYNSENLLKIMIKDEQFKSNCRMFCQEVSTLPGVVSAAGTMWAPPSNSVFSYQIPHPRNPDENIVLDVVNVDYNFMETMQFRLIKGRFFSEERGTDEQSIILNETASREIGEEDILGLNTYLGEVIGIVEDFHIHSLHSAVKPQAFLLAPQRVREVVVRIKPDQDVQDINRQITEVYHRFSPDARVSVFTFDEELYDMYQEEVVLRKILVFFTILVILIASLGLFGLSMFLSEIRTKEISIRKVHGAGVRQIIHAVVNEFLVLTIISWGLAWPISWLLISRWLQNFPYRIGFTWWIFLLAAGGSLVLVFIALGYQSIQAIRSQPARALKYE